MKELSKTEKQQGSDGKVKVASADIFIVRDILDIETLLVDCHYPGPFSNQQNNYFSIYTFDIFHPPLI